MRQTLPNLLTAASGEEEITADDHPGAPALRHFSRFIQGQPMPPATHEVTKLLKDWGAGDKSAVDKLMPLVHDELHRLARAAHYSGGGLEVLRKSG